MWGGQINFFNRVGQQNFLRGSTTNFLKVSRNNFLIINKNFWTVNKIFKGGRGYSTKLFGKGGQKICIDFTYSYKAYTYIYIHIHSHIYIYIYIYIHILAINYISVLGFTVP